MKGLVFLSVALLVFVAFSTLGSADHPDERSASFIGASFVGHDVAEKCAALLDERECRTGVPQGLAFFACDGEETPWVGGLYDGIGGVKFCDVPDGALVRVGFGELNVDLMTSGIVWCEMYPNEGYEFGQITQDTSLEFEVPRTCNADHSDHPEVAEIFVFIQNASLTEPALYRPVEGEVRMRVLSTGGSA